MNNLAIIGNLTRDPVLRYTPGGKAVCDLRVAVNGVGDAKPLYLDLASFDAQAEACAKHLRKGRQIGFVGRLVYSEWTAEDGSKRPRPSVPGSPGTPWGGSCAFTRTRRRRAARGRGHRRAARPHPSSA